MEKVKLNELSWPEVAEVLKRPNVVLLPVGSMEQHSLHLPLNVDSCCATYIAEQAAKKVTGDGNIRVLVAPAIEYTWVQGDFSKFPGTIGVSVDTLLLVIGDIIRGFISQGFNTIILVNGHFPNSAPLSLALGKTSIEFPETGLYLVDWWKLGFDVIPRIRKSSELGFHADELETSLMLVIQPENVHMEKAVEDRPGYSLSERYVGVGGRGPVTFHSRKKFPKMGTSPGVMGDPTVASRETGEKIIAAVVDDLADIIAQAAKHA